MRNYLINPLKQKKIIFAETKINYHEKNLVINPATFNYSL